VVATPYPTLKSCSVVRWVYSICEAALTIAAIVNASSNWRFRINAHFVANFVTAAMHINTVRIQWVTLSIGRLSVSVASWPPEGPMTSEFGVQETDGKMDVILKGVEKYNSRAFGQRVHWLNRCLCRAP
jgi:hypothetical protein